MMGYRPIRKGKGLGIVCLYPIGNISRPRQHKGEQMFVFTFDCLIVPGLSQYEYDKDREWNPFPPSMSVFHCSGEMDLHSHGFQPRFPIFQIFFNIAVSSSMQVSMGDFVFFMFGSDDLALQKSIET
jgi:hypothetical protein